MNRHQDEGYSDTQEYTTESSAIHIRITVNLLRCWHYVFWRSVRQWVFVMYPPCDVSNMFLNKAQWMVSHHPLCVQRCFPNDKTCNDVGAVFFVSFGWSWQIHPKRSLSDSATIRIQINAMSNVEFTCFCLVPMCERYVEHRHDHQLSRSHSGLVYCSCFVIRHSWHSTLFPSKWGSEFPWSPDTDEYRSEEVFFCVHVLLLVNSQEGPLRYYPQILCSTVRKGDNGIGTLYSHQYSLVDKRVTEEIKGQTFSDHYFIHLLINSSTVGLFINLSTRVLLRCTGAGDVTVYLDNFTFQLALCDTSSQSRTGNLVFDLLLDGGVNFL